MSEAITVSTVANAPIEKVWEYFTLPQHITKWYQASADWHAPYAENDIRTGGNFKTTMAAKDGSFSFDFEGTYTLVEEQSFIAYDIVDGRRVTIKFTLVDDGVAVVENFEAENINPLEMQRGGWQAILDSFKAYTENN